MGQHYQTRYAEFPEFFDKRELNEKIIREEYLPHFANCGFSFSPKCIDDVAFELSSEERERWIEPIPALNGIRFPDLRMEAEFIKLAGTDATSALFEVKDQPQMNRFLTTGIPHLLVRRYWAVQNLIKIPVFPLFRDSAIQELGTEELEPYTSAYKTKGVYIPYGGLLADMPISHDHERGGRSYAWQKNAQSWWKREIHWMAQPRWGRDGSARSLLVLPEITELLKSGKIRKVVGDPTGRVPLFDLIQDAAVGKFEKSGIPPHEPLRIPKGGMVWFTALDEGKKPKVDSDNWPEL